MSENKKIRVPKVKKSEPCIVHVPTEDSKEVESPPVKELKIRKPRKKKGVPMALVDSSDDSVEESKPQEVSGSGSDSSPKKKPSNNWIDHVKSFRESHPDVSYKDALKQAKETYKK